MNRFKLCCVSLKANGIFHHVQYASEVVFFQSTCVSVMCMTLYFFFFFLMALAILFVLFIFFGMVLAKADPQHVRQFKNTGYSSSEIYKNTGYSSSEIYKNTGYSASEIYKNTGYSASEIYKNTGYSASEIYKNTGYSASKIYKTFSNISECLLLYVIVRVKTKLFHSKWRTKETILTSHRVISVLVKAAPPRRQVPLCFVGLPVICVSMYTRRCLPSKHNDGRKC